MWANRQVPRCGRWQFTLICFSPSGPENGITGPTLLHIKKLTPDRQRPKTKVIQRGTQRWNFNCYLCAHNRLASICNLKKIFWVYVCAFVHACWCAGTTMEVRRQPRVSVHGGFHLGHGRVSLLFMAAWPKCFQRCLCLLVAMLDLQTGTTVPLCLHSPLWGFELRSCLQSLYPLSPGMCFYLFLFN